MDSGVVCDYVVGDVRSPEDLRKAMAGRELVYNLAAEHQDNVIPLSLYMAVNVIGARNICAVATESGVKHMIFTSSVAVYGAQSKPMKEDAEHAFFNEYGRTKHLAEAEYQAWLEASSSNRLTVIRPTVVFGPGNRGNVYNFLRQIKHGPFLMFGEGANMKSMAFVDNIGAFLAFLALKPERYGVYNYADKPNFTVRQLVRFVDQTLGGPERERASFPVPMAVLAGHIADVVSFMLRRPLPLSSVRVKKFCAPSVVDAEKAFATGFVPPVDMAEGLKAMVLDHV
jgi:nucleoside-diphosphate-sugar epimerase